MPAVTFTPDRFYRVLSSTTIPVGDVAESWPTCLALSQNEVVLCEAIVRRSGVRGRGLYAQCRINRGEYHPSLVFWHRVSRNRIGSGDWEEINEMEVLALADVLPLD